MTTIAYRNGIVAADSRACRGDKILPGGAQKLFRLADGRIAAICGPYAEGMKLLHWLKGPRDVEQPSGECSVIVFGADGVEVYEDGHFGPEASEFMAWGSGAGPALGALHAGKGAEEAARIACLVDIYSGGDVISMKVAEEE